jgi:HTH-type transcriptional regulator / antitoxin MqsA
MCQDGGQCPICGHEGLQKKTIIETFEYKGKKFDFPNYVIYECSQCGEAIVDKKSMKESGRAIRDFYRKVDGLLTAEEITKIRKFKLCLTQDGASKLLGGGAKGFARYENSEVIQSEAMDNLLRILDVYPHLINVIKDKNRTQQGVVLKIPSTFGTGPQGKMIGRVVNYD